jgi:hypothetical protein
MQLTFCTVADGWLLNSQEVSGWYSMGTKAIYEKDNGKMILLQQGCVTSHATNSTLDLLCDLV